MWTNFLLRMLNSCLAPVSPYQQLFLKKGEGKNGIQRERYQDGKRYSMCAVWGFGKSSVVDEIVQRPVLNNIQGGVPDFDHHIVQTTMLFIAVFASLIKVKTYTGQH